MAKIIRFKPKNDKDTYLVNELNGVICIDFISDKIKYGDNELERVLEKKINFDFIESAIRNPQKIIFKGVSQDYISFRDSDDMGAQALLFDVLAILNELDSNCKYQCRYMDDDKYLYLSDDMDKAFRANMSSKCPFCDSDKVNGKETYFVAQPKVVCADCGKSYVPEN